jgi:hypothetical protein
MTSALQASLLDVTSAGLKAAKAGRERVFHIDSDPARVCVTGLALLEPAEAVAAAGGGGKRSADTRALLQEILTKETGDAIACIAASDKCLIVARESGTIMRYSLPHVAYESKFIVRCRPQQIAGLLLHSRVVLVPVHRADDPHLRFGYHERHPVGVVDREVPERNAGLQLDLRVVLVPVHLEEDAYVRHESDRLGRRAVRATNWMT